MLILLPVHLCQDVLLIRPVPVLQDLQSTGHTYCPVGGGIAVGRSNRYEQQIRRICAVTSRATSVAHINCHTCLSLITSMHTHTHTYILTYIYICIYIHTHTHIYIYIHGDSQIYTQGFCLSISSFKGCRCPVIRNPSRITTCDNLS